MERNPFNTFGASIAVVTAYRIGLIKLLLEPEFLGLPQFLSAKELAKKLNANEQGIEVLLGTLIELGIATMPSMGKYRISPEYYQLNQILPKGLLGDIEYWSHMEEFILSQSWEYQSRTPEAMGQAYQSKAFQVYHMYERQAKSLASQLDVRKRTLDIGAGSGVWSRTIFMEHQKISKRFSPVATTERSSSIAKKSDGGRSGSCSGLYAECTVTFMDLPQVLKRLIEHNMSWSVPNYAYIPGDFTKIDNVGKFDRIIIANVLHLFQPKEAKALLNKWAGWLEEKGELILIDSFGLRDRLGTELYRIHLAMRMREGVVHEAGDIQTWISDDDFEPLLEYKRDLMMGPPESIQAMVFERESE